MTRTRTRDASGTGTGDTGRRADVPATEQGAPGSQRAAPEAARQEPASQAPTAGTGSWAQVEAEAPELAAAVRASFAVRKHCTMATLRADGSPRISGTEVQWQDGELQLGSMPGALKVRDLQRDGRVAIHSPTVDPPVGDESSWAGEAKVAGRAVEVASDDGSHRFRVQVEEAVHTAVDGDRLRIRSWHRGRGVQERHRA